MARAARRTDTLHTECGRCMRRDFLGAATARAHVSHAMATLDTRDRSTRRHRLPDRTAQPTGPVTWSADDSHLCAVHHRGDHRRGRSGRRGRPGAGVARWAVVEIAVWAVSMGIVVAQLYHVHTCVGDSFYPGANLWNVFAIGDDRNAIYGSLIGGTFEVVRRLVDRIGGRGGRRIRGWRGVVWHTVSRLNSKRLGSAAEESGEEVPAFRLRRRDLLGGMASVAPLVRGHASSDLADVLAAAGPGGLSAGLAGRR